MSGAHKNSTQYFEGGLPYLNLKVHASTIRKRLYIGDSTQVKGKVHVDETRDTECVLQINGEQFITDGLKTCNCIELTFLDYNQIVL